MLGFDVLVVLLFVVFGRQSHDETNALGEVARTVTPFLIALIGAWWISGAARHPMLVRTGAIVGLTTAVGGALVRRFIFDDGIANPFVFVATGFILALTIGWRLAATWLSRRRPTAA